MQYYTCPNTNYQIVIDLDRDSLLNSLGKELLQDGYLKEGETSPQHAFARVSCAFADNQEHAQRLYNYASQLWFMFATPVLANGGTKAGLPISCFVSHIDDTVDDLIAKASENAYIAVAGGGTGANWSSIRSLGTRISRTGGKTPGLIPFLKVMDSIQSAYQQSGTRRGSTAAYLDVSHPEIEEFLEVRDAIGADPQRRCLSIGFHHAVNIPDAFMQAVVEGLDWNLIDPHTKEVKATVYARDLWKKILTARIETGEPYLHFIDTSNKALPQVLKDKGLKIRSSQLCVAPETLLLTSKGHLPIGTLENKEVVVWNGEEWSTVTVRKTDTNTNLVRVVLSDGSSIDCTPEHNFFIHNRRTKSSDKYAAKDLVPGMKIERVLSFPLLTEGTSLNHAYDLGFYSGDGNEGYKYSWIYEPKYSVVNRLSLGSVIEDGSTVARKKWVHGDLLNKFFVPTDCDLKSKLDWLAGYADADGYVQNSLNGQNIQLTSTNYNFLFQIKLMLQTMGVQSNLFFRRPEGDYLMPLNNGSGEEGLFNCAEIWMLNIGCFGVKTLLDLGFKTERLTFSIHQSVLIDKSRFVKVVSVTDVGRISDTFCATEPLRNRLVFNGTVTGNCAEIFLPTEADRTAVCCLSSVNLDTYDEWGTDSEIHDLFVEDLFRMLDNVLGTFIKDAPPSLWRAVNSATKERSVGLGAMGFHSFLQSKMVAFESAKAQTFNQLIFSKLRVAAHKANKVLGAEKGSPEDLQGTGDRFAHMFAIAPNANSSIICGNISPSIEPLNSNAYTQDTKVGVYSHKNKYLVDLLALKDYDKPEVWTDIFINGGSVQHLSFLTDEEKKVFKTAFEIEQEWIITHASDRQPYICQGQSVNLFLRPDIKYSVLHNLHKMAWELGLKSLYYCRSKKISEVKRQETTPKPVVKCEEDVCLVCQG